MNDNKKTLWELLWDYDPNGLIVVDPDLTIKVVNTAFCQMLKKSPEDLIGKNAALFLDDVEDFEEVWEKGKIIKAKEKTYEAHDLHVKKVLFPLKNENMIACIMVDVTHEWKQKQEFLRLKEETVAKVNQVVDKQMKVVQEIASLLGETTAETKVGLMNLIEMLKQEE